jgi:phosphatidate phosphatase APP1
VGVGDRALARARRADAGGGARLVRHPGGRGWRAELAGIAETLAARVRGAADAVDRLGDRDPHLVVGYRGYAGDGRALVLGRALEDEGIPAPDAAHGAWRNLVATLRRMESDPLPFARVRARIGGAVHEVTADDEGFLRAWVDAPLAPGEAGWHDVALELDAAPRDGGAAPAAGTARVLVPPATARFGVVSDMDDTVIQSHVTSFVRAARTVLLENALTRLPFPGVAAFYRALGAGAAGGEGNPIFYVSSSPWNLFDVIDGFLEAQGIPAGPLLLRDWDAMGLAGRHAGHKGPAIREVLATFPRLPFVLVGDSGQEDPEIYAELVREHPGRILAVYIRNVTGAARAAAVRALAEEVTAAGSSLVLADDTLAAARHAAERGWIASGALPEIGEEKRDDEGTTGAKADAPGVPDEGDATGTVVVE